MPDNPLIFDGHNDTLLNLHLNEQGGGRSFFVRDDRGHIDLPRALEGGLGGGFFAMFVPTKRLENGPDAKGSDRPGKAATEEIDFPSSQRYAQEFTDTLIRLLFDLEKASQGKVKIVRTTAEVATCLENGVHAAVMHFEGAEVIDLELENLNGYYDQGLRSLGITWSRSNGFGYGVPFEFDRSPDTGPGLTTAGKHLVKECNRLGIMIDLSHLNEKGFWDVASITESPLVATHSAAYRICPSTRNLTDKQIDAIGESDGIIGINFHVGFIRSDGKEDSDTPIDDIVRHAVYVANRIGVDHVALGSDFDGATMPDELGDASGLPKLILALRRGGFNDQEIGKIAHKNWLRVLDQSWKQ
ncbi:MAG: dipeptidase [Candidatus Promineifilaceae bacterium]